MKLEKNNNYTILTLVHNEAGVIEGVVAEIYEKIISRLPKSELLVVEDGSSDGTKEILTRLRNELGFTLLMETSKQGYTAALHQAFQAARGRAHFIFFTDSDGQHDQADFWKLNDLIGGADMVIGVKAHRQDSWFRNIISCGMNRLLVPALFGVRLKDINCGFRLMRREVVEYLLEEKWFFKDCVFAELTLRSKRAGGRIAEAPISHSMRRFGSSTGLPARKMPAILLRIVKNFVKLRVELKSKPSTVSAKSVFE